MDTPQLPPSGIIFYGRDTCRDCLRAKRTLEGIVYDYRNVEEDTEARETMTGHAEALGVPAAVPMIIVPGPEGGHGTSIFIEPQREALEALRTVAEQRVASLGGGPERG